MLRKNRVSASLQPIHSGIINIFAIFNHYIVPPVSLQSIEEPEVHVEELKVQDISSSNHEESKIHEIDISNNEVRIQNINPANNEDEEDKMEY